MVSNKVLVKADVTQFQTVGGGSGPSAMDLFNAVRGRGKAPGSKVSRTGRLVGLAGLAGKGAALGATALSTADAMQGGNIAAPLGAGYTYQGLDPTGAMTAGQIQGTVPQAPAPIPQNYPAPVMPPAHEQKFTPEGNPIPIPQNYPTPAPAPAAPAPAPAPAAPAPAAPAPATTLSVGNFGMGGTGPTFNNQNPLGMDQSAMMAAGQQPAQQVPPVGVQGTTQQQVPPVGVVPHVALPGQNLTPSQKTENMKAAGRGPPGSPNFREMQAQATQEGTVQNIQHYGPESPPGSHNQTDPFDAIYDGHDWVARNNLKNAGEFTDMLFDILGPDNLYKMTPNEIGELAAFMYIKTR